MAVESRTATRVQGAAAASLAVCLLLTGAAQAATVRVTTGDDVSRARFEAAPGEANALSVSVPRAGVLRFRDDGAPVTAGVGCTQLAPNEADCLNPQHSEYIRAVVDAGDGDDVVRGSPGADEIAGGPGADQLFGNTGHDVFTPGGLEPDAVDGGPGRDGVEYGERTDPLRIDLGRDRAAEDTLISIQEVSGGQGRDTIVGSDRVETLAGGPGADRIEGRGGPDALFGAAGNDHLDGEAGNDRLHGDRGSDRLYGGLGNDHLYGMYDDSRDIWTAIEVGANRHECGEGIDRVHHLKKLEFVRDDCEYAGLPNDEPLFRLPAVRRPGDPVIVLEHTGGCAVGVGCPKTVTVTLRERSRVVGRARFRSRANVAIRLSPFGQRVLQRRRRMVIRLYFADPRGARRGGGFSFEVDV
jgi:hypothetical protein